VLVGGTVAVTLYAPDGRVAYSSDRRSAATPGRSTGISTRVESRAGAKVLTVLVPVRVGRGAGTFALHQDYGPIASSARRAFLPVAGVLELALLGLYLSLFPILRRVTRRLRGHLREIEHQALHDGLTGLPNRDLFHTRVDEALVEARQRNAGVAVLLLDLDRFKEINDTLGHQSGDLLLQALAKRLGSLIRATDTVARLGGDEFAVVSPGAGDEESALQLAERISAGLEDPFVLDGLTLEIEASVGIALFPKHGEDVEALVRHADVAMYVGKKTHRPNLYSVKDDHYSPDRLALVGELRRAVAQSELVVHYQPRVEMASGQTRSVEALVRWEHPDRGLLSPAEFLPLAEHTGLIRPVTRYVLDAALADCASWQRAGLLTGISVNLSPRDLLDFELADEVESMLAKHGIEPALLELEITENTILTDPERVRAVLGRLRELGVTLAIDDFGTGFSSLGQLKRLPVDIVKIDKSFVLNMAHDENDDVIVRSTIELGHNLGLRVVAEGVETQETWDRLAALGCDTAQGFYLSRPLPKIVLDDWLRKRASDTGAGHLRLVG
jgi:diguanylate cyclase (GGDEF)-like protein